MGRIRWMQDVVDWGLCVGCGSCAQACDRQAVRMVSLASIGLRPLFDPAVCRQCSTCLEFCPGVCVSNRMPDEDAQRRADPLIGPYRAVWEGYAGDAQIRLRASSGGVLSALSLFCLEQAGMQAVVHVAAGEAPFVQQCGCSRSRAEILDGSGSRYMPSAPCAGLPSAGSGRRAFVGKPCDVAAVRALGTHRPRQVDGAEMLLTFFCAGTPSAAGVAALVRRVGLDPAAVREVRFRGNGWPGYFEVRTDEGWHTQLLPYEQAWHFLQRYRSMRCKLCADGLGEVGDISCGDAWHRYDPQQSDPGRSLIIVRTARGEALLQGAVAAGYIVADPAAAADVVRAQGLVNRKQQQFGRQLAMGLLGVPCTRYEGFALRQSWQQLPPGQRCLSFAGTLRRLLVRGLWRRQRPPYACDRETALT